MNYDLLFAILFYGLVFIFFLKNRKKFQIHAKIIALYKTKIGLKLMDKLATFKKFFKVLGYIGVVFGFAGMFFIFYYLIKGTINLLSGVGVPAVAPILPGVRVSGLPVLSFWHWIIAIFIVAVVHEFAHGVLARSHNVKVKSSGFAFFGPILAAFVEPDEKQLSKKKKRQQLSILSAGPFSNILVGLLCFVVMLLLITPLQNTFFEGDGVLVHKLIEKTPAGELNLKAPFRILSINEDEIKDAKTLLEATSKLKPNQKIVLKTDKGDFDLITDVNPEDPEKGFMGVSDFEMKNKIREKYIPKESWINIFSWLSLLVLWLFVINIGIGLFNLLPIGPVDGGRMFYLLSLAIIKDPIKAKKFWSSISLFCLLLILINLMPYIMKLLVFLIKPLIFLLG